MDTKERLLEFIISKYEKKKLNCIFYLAITANRTIIKKYYRSNCKYSVHTYLKDFGSCCSLMICTDNVLVPDVNFSIRFHGSFIYLCDCCTINVFSGVTPDNKKNVSLKACPLRSQ